MASEKAEASSLAEKADTCREACDAAGAIGIVALAIGGSCAAKCMGKERRDNATKNAVQKWNAFRAKHSTTANAILATLVLVQAVLFSLDIWSDIVLIIAVRNDPGDHDWWFGFLVSFMVQVSKPSRTSVESCPQIHHLLSCQAYVVSWALLVSFIWTASKGSAHRCRNVALAVLFGWALIPFCDVLMLAMALPGGVKRRINACLPARQHCRVSIYVCS